MPGPGPETRITFPSTVLPMDPSRMTPNPPPSFTPVAFTMLCCTSVPDATPTVTPSPTLRSSLSTTRVPLEPSKTSMEPPLSETLLRTVSSLPTTPTPCVSDANLLCSMTLWSVMRKRAYPLVPDAELPATNAPDEPISATATTPGLVIVLSSTTVLVVFLATMAAPSMSEIRKRWKWSPTAPFSTRTPSLNCWMEPPSTVTWL